MVNLTQHPATPEQVAAGVRDLPPEERSLLGKLLTFEEIPTCAILHEVAALVADLVPNGEDSAMIGGAPFFMAPLEKALLSRGISPVYAFSRRESIEQTQADGSVRKVAVFRHAGFVLGGRLA